MCLYQDVFSGTEYRLYLILYYLIFRMYSMYFCIYIDVNIYFELKKTMNMTNFKLRISN